MVANAEGDGGRDHEATRRRRLEALGRTRLRRLPMVRRGLHLVTLIGTALVLVAVVIAALPGRRPGTTQLKV